MCPVGVVVVVNRGTQPVTFPHTPAGSSDLPQARWALTLGVTLLIASRRLGLAALLRARGSTISPDHVSVTIWLGLALIHSDALIGVSDPPHTVWAPTRGVTLVVADPRPGLTAHLGARGPTVIPDQVAVTFWLWGLALMLSHALVGISDPPHAGWALTLGPAHRDASR